MVKSARVRGGATRALGLMIKVVRVCRGHPAQEMSRLAEIPVDSYRRTEDGQYSATAEELLRIAAVMGIKLSRMVEIIEDAGALPDTLDAATRARFVRAAVELAGRDEDILNHHVIQRLLL